MNDLPVSLDQIAARLDTLEKRVSMLERTPSQIAVAAEARADILSCSDVAEPVTLAPDRESTPSPESAQTMGLFSLIGRAMLGIAGAYVLRAVAEATLMPRIVVASIAIIYALTWLLWAARTKASGWLPCAVYASTSALILAPMLWELALSFSILSPAVVAAILAVFVIAASLLAWKRDLTPIFWIANLTAAFTALALSIGTREMIPFLAVLLLMAVLCEYAVDRNHARSIRPLVAIAADLAIFNLYFIYSGPQSARPDYRALDTASLLVPACTLFLIYAVSIVLRTVLLEKNITVFESVQATIGFAFIAFGSITFAPQFGSAGLGSFCLMLAAACYAMAFAFMRRSAKDRNLQVFAAWASLFLAGGSVLALPAFGQALCLGMTAIALIGLAVRLHLPGFQVHGLVLLVLAAVSSQLASYAFHSLAGTLPLALTPGTCFVALCVFGCYWAGEAMPLQTRRRELFRLIPATLAACVLAATLVQLALHLLSARLLPGVHHIAFIRTLAACVVALALAFSGARGRRPEFTHISYAMLAFVAAKLLFEDLRHGHFEFIAASIFLFALSLMIVPRFATMRKAA